MIQQTTARLMLFLVLFCLAACGHPQYKAEELILRGAREIKGVVTNQGRGTFLLTDDSGTENKYCTGEMTQYIPAGYRSQDGDTVRVAFTESMETTGKLKRTVLQLESITIPEKNKALAGISGEIVALGRGSSRHSLSIAVRPDGGNNSLSIYIRGGSPENDMLNYRDDLIGKRIRVSLHRTPILRGNAYIYEAESAAWINE